MALTRKFLAALGIEADKIDEIIAAHSETVDALKEQRDRYKADAEKLPEVTKERDELKQAATDNDGYKTKYDSLKAEYDGYKAEQTNKDTQAKISAAYTALLKGAGVSEKRIPAILKVTDLSAAKLDAEGKLEGADKLTDGIKADWADFIETKGEKGAETANPPANNGAKMTKEDILKIKDTSERQKAIAENHELFDF